MKAAAASCCISKLKNPFLNQFLLKSLTKLYSSNVHQIQHQEEEIYAMEKGVEVNLWLQENQTNYKLTMLLFFNCNCRKLNPVQDCYITAPCNAFKCFNFITSHVSC